jgi:hypothetical protein
LEHRFIEAGRARPVGSLDFARDRQQNGALRSRQGLGCEDDLAPADSECRKRCPNGRHDNLSVSGALYRNNRHMKMG